MVFQLLDEATQDLTTNVVYNLATYGPVNSTGVSATAAVAGEDNIVDITVGANGANHSINTTIEGDHNTAINVSHYEDSLNGKYRASPFEENQSAPLGIDPPSVGKALAFVQRLGAASISHKALL